MNMTSAMRIIIKVVFAFGVLITIGLGIICLFGSNDYINPSAMLPISWKEQAFICLAIGTIPMAMACTGVYLLNNIKNSKNNRRNAILIFLPGAVCLSCALFIIGVIIYGMINTFVFSGK